MPKYLILLGVTNLFKWELTKLLIMSQKKIHQLLWKNWSTNSIESSWKNYFLFLPFFRCKNWDCFFISFVNFPLWPIDIMFVRLTSSMNWNNMFIQVALWRTSVFTNFTFEGLLSLMNRCNMCIHVTLSRTAKFTNVTFEWLISFMNRCNMCFHMILFKTAVVTKVTFEWFFSFMNRFNMYIATLWLGLIYYAC